MRFALNADRVEAGSALMICLGLAMSGCGTPGAPQPPSLKLPERVTDLTAVRAGSSVTLHWTMPKKTTDHLLIRGPVRAEVCRREGIESCQPAGEVSLAPGVKSEFRDSLPAALAVGNPQSLDYFVELKSPKGRSAGLSNAAIVLSGSAPGPVTGLSAEVRSNGVALHWSGSEISEVRLHRKLLTPPEPRKKSDSSPMAGSPELEIRDLLVEAPIAGQPVGALDSTARFGEAYEYTAQRVRKITINGGNSGMSLELAGEISAPIRVDVVDTFPPAVPQDLVAVLVLEEKTIDLSWQPDTDEDLAGYFVYRAESDGDWNRISGALPLAGPAFRDPAIQAGHAYRYAVSAIDLTGHESKRSMEAREAVPETPPNQ